MAFSKSIDDSPPWAVPYGAEFWRRETESQSSTPANPMLPGPQTEHINIGDIIARVSHAISEDSTGESGTASGRGFRAKFDPEGFHISVNGSETKSGGEAKYQTLSIWQGENLLYAPGLRKLQWSLLGNSAQTALDERGSVIEHYETTDKGVEITWVLKEKPPGGGDLKIQGYLNGVTFSGESNSGYLFRESRDSAAVQLGSATLVDSAGIRSPLKVTPHNEQFQIEVPEKLLLASTFPVAIDPTVGPEFGIDACMMTNAQVFPAVTWNNTNYLVVWEDGRNAPSGEQNQWDIYGTRVSAAGVVLDPAGIAISSGSAVESAPRVASDGRNYFVVWEDGRNSVEIHNVDIYGARVQWDGTLLDSSGIAICTVAGDQTAPDVGCNGTNYLVAWTDARSSGQLNGGEIYGARVLVSGKLLDTTSFRIGGNPNALLAASPHLACDGADYLVVWDDFDDSLAFEGSYGARVTSGGLPLDGNGFAVNGDSGHPQVAYAKSAANYLVIYDASQGNYRGVYGNRVTTQSGVSVLDGSGFVISVVAQSGQSSVAAGSLASNGTNYLAVLVATESMSLTNHISGARVRASDGTVLDAQSFTIGAVLDPNRNQFWPGTVAGGGDFLVAWTDGVPPNRSADYGDIYAARVTDAGKTLDYIPVSTQSGNSATERRPAVASSGSDLLVAWYDDRNSSTNRNDIYATRINSYGRVLDPCGIRIASTATDEFNPAVGYSGSYYLVAWVQSNTNIFAARIDSSGVVADSPAIAVSVGHAFTTQPAVSGNGSDFLVVWNDTRNGGLTVYGSRISSSGSVLDSAGISISRATGGLRPAVASIGTDYLVTWVDGRNGSTNLDIYAARVTGGGVVSDPAGFAICSASKNQEFPAVAANGTDYLVAWVDLGTSPQSLFGNRVTPAGQVLDGNGFQILSGVGNPAVASLSGNFLVVGNGTVASRIGADGTVLDPGGFTIESSGGQNATVAASTPNYFVFYETTSGTLKVRGHIVTP